MLRTPGKQRSVLVLRREPGPGGVKMWAFGVRHIAALCRASAKEIARGVSDRLRGSVWSGPDPRVLPSIVAWAVKLRRDELERAGLGADLEAARRVLDYLELGERRALGLVDDWTPYSGELARECNRAPPVGPEMVSPNPHPTRELTMYEQLEQAVFVAALIPNEQDKLEVRVLRSRYGTPGECPELRAPMIVASGVATPGDLVATGREPSKLDAILQCLDDKVWVSLRSSADTCPADHVYVVRAVDGEVIGSGTTSDAAAFAAIKVKLAAMHRAEVGLRAELGGLLIKLRVVRDLIEELTS